MRRFCIWMLAVMLLFGILPVSVFAEGSLTEEEIQVDDVVFHDGWDVEDQNLVFYEIFVGSFSDSNGDGTGDLRGIINRMDYLNDGDPVS